MPAPEIDIHHIARLARLALTEEEAASHKEQLSRILGHIDQLSSHPLDAEPSAHAMPVFDVLRADEPRAGFPQATALANAPQQAMEQFRIVKVME